MKAKQYSEIYLNSEYSESTAVLNKILSDFINELHELRKIRNIKLDKGLVPIIKELDSKFRKFAMIVNSNNQRTHNIKPNGFLSVIKDLMPPLYEFYIENNKP